MKAIYIWKSDKPINSTSNKIKFVRGSTWWLEDNGKSNRSYEIINGFLVDNGIIYLVEERAIDWIGENYLETIYVDYDIFSHKDEKLGKEIEQIGLWSRWNSGMDISGIDEALALADHVKLNLYGFSSGKKE